MENLHNHLEKYTVCLDKSYFDEITPHAVSPVLYIFTFPLILGIIFLAYVHASSNNGMVRSIALCFLIISLFILLFIINAIF